MLTTKRIYRKATIYHIVTQGRRGTLFRAADLIDQRTKANKIHIRRISHQRHRPIDGTGDQMMTAAQSLSHYLVTTSANRGARAGLVERSEQIGQGLASSVISVWEL